MESLSDGGEIVNGRKTLSMDAKDATLRASLDSCGSARGWMRTTRTSMSTSSS